MTFSATMKDFSKPELSATKITSSFTLKSIISQSRIRQIQRAIRNVKITILCSCVTILVLRGALGAGKFGTPAQDLEEIREHMHWRRDATSRVLTEAKEIDNVAQEKDEEEKNQNLLHDPSTPSTLGAKISDWDEQRKVWLMENKHKPATKNGKPRIILVTGSQPKACSNPAGDHYLLKSIKNKIDYCRLHDIEIFYNMANLDLEMAGFWDKLPVIREMLLTHPETEWLWWMESDALFTDMAFDLPMERYGKHNLILYAWDDAVYGKKGSIKMNSGSLLIRNCQWSLDLLDAWALKGRKAPECEADDQSALVQLLVTHGGKWGDKVYLENSYDLHGRILVDRYGDMMKKHHIGLGDDLSPFVTHFVGCNPCGGRGDYPVDNCFREMERAFNFADNQVLRAYGFKHRRLGNASVRRTHLYSQTNINNIRTTLQA